jgi:Domain of unknown function (DUF4249)
MKLHPLLFGLFGSLLFLSCEKVITLDLPAHEPILVVNSFFSPDSVWRARVTASQAIDAPYGLKEIADASVLILENGVPVDTLVHDSADLYVSTRGRKPVAGHAYTLRASAPGYAEVQGSDIAPRVVIPYNLVFKDSVFVDAIGTYQSEFSFTIRDWPGQHNYYILDLYKIYTYLWDNRLIRQANPIYVDTQDPLLDTKTSQGQALFDDATFDGQQRLIKVSLPAAYHQENDTIYARLSVVTEPCFRYVQTMAKYRTASWDIFAEPVRLYSNMTPGMGVFAGRAGYEMILP